MTSISLVAVYLFSTQTPSLLFSGHRVTPKKGLSLLDRPLPHNTMLGRGGIAEKLSLNFSVGKVTSPRRYSRCRLECHIPNTDGSVAIVARIRQGASSADKCTFGNEIDHLPCLSRYVRHKGSDPSAQLDTALPFTRPANAYFTHDVCLE